MSEVQTPPQAPDPQQPPATRQCPRCGAAMTEEQEWCLACGAAVGTRVVAAPGWRAPLIITGVLAVIAAIAIAVAIIQLADDTDTVAQDQPPATAEATPTPPPATTPTPDPLLDPNATATPDPNATQTPEATTTPEATATPEATTTPEASGSIGSWPAGESGWTVVLASTTSESSANDKAQGFIDDGISDVGVLNSDDFGSLKAGYWVVYSGQYDSQAQAGDALDGIDASDAYVRQISPN